MGGYRPTAGRPKGSKDSAPRAPRLRKERAPKGSVIAGGKEPLGYMLAVMNDEAADHGRRDRMAIAAAPYVHVRADVAKPGKKEEAEQAALTAERGTSWETLLN